MITSTSSCISFFFIGFFLLNFFRSAFSLPCSSFYDLTVDNFEAADLATYYKSWVLTASTKPEFLSYGEVGLFFHEKLGTDVKCDVSRMGCKGLPTCTEIRDTLSGNDEEARRVYFVSKIVDNMSLFAGLVYVSNEPPRYVRLSLFRADICFAAGNDGCTNRYLEHPSCCC
jgi:hypothetical protein